MARKSRHTIMDSHEIYCRHLKEKVVHWSLSDLISFRKLTNKINSYEDYFMILDNEITKRNAQK